MHHVKMHNHWRRRHFVFKLVAYLLSDRRRLIGFRGISKEAERQ